LKNKTLNDFLNNGVLNIEDIVTTYSSYIYTILKNSIDSSEDIEELISDVFIALWNNYKRLDVSMELKPYLSGIAKNLIKKKYRELSNNIELCDIADYEGIAKSIDISIVAEQSEKNKYINKVLNELKDEEKQIFLMFYYNSKKVKEIAKILDISVSKVKTTLHRVRKKLKSELKKGGYSYE